MPRDPENLRRWKQANRAKLNAQSREDYQRHKAQRNAKRNEHYALHADQERQYQRDKRAADPEATREYERQWAAANPDKVKARSKRYYDTHQKQLIDKAIQWAKENPDKVREKSREASRKRRATDPEKETARIKAWIDKNPERHRMNGQVRDQKRRARIAGASRNDVTPEQRRLVLLVAKGRCAYCPHFNPTCALCSKGTHKGLEVDHITSIVAGGDNTLHNLAACCRSCNAKKHAKPTPIPIQPLLL